MTKREAFVVRTPVGDLTFEAHVKIPADELRVIPKPLGQVRGVGGDGGVGGDVLWLHAEHNIKPGDVVAASYVNAERDGIPAPPLRTGRLHVARVRRDGALVLREDVLHAIPSLCKGERGDWLYRVEPDDKIVMAHDRISMQHAFDAAAHSYAGMRTEAMKLLVDATRKIVMAQAAAKSPPVEAGTKPPSSDDYLFVQSVRDDSDGRWRVVWDQNNQDRPASPRDRHAEITAASVRTEADPKARLADVEAFIRDANRNMERVDKYVLMERDLLRDRIAREPCGALYQAKKDEVAAAVAAQQESRVRYLFERPLRSPDHCSACRATLYYSDRKRGDGRCGPCSRGAAPPTIETPWVGVDLGSDPPTFVTAPDPLDVKYDGVTLRDLISIDGLARCESKPSQRERAAYTPAQRAAVSAHWSAELRARVEAGKRADAAQATSVVLDCAEEL